MRSLKFSLPAVTLVSVFLISLCSLSYAATPDRITGPIDSSKVVVLKNHVSSLARPQFDQGPVETSRMMQVTMLFLPTAEQEQALTGLISQQQDAKSPSYHQWLTVSQYAEQFGLSPSDIGKVKAWLGAQGFTVSYVANGRDFIRFEGTAGLVQSVFHTQIHNYNVNGKMHFANVAPPMIPAALNGIVGGFRGLHNFVPSSMLRKRPNYTFTDGGNTYTAIAPGDLATLYQITPLYNNSINGKGVNVVIAGQTDVYIADINYFRSAFGLTQLSECTLDSTQTILQAGKCGVGNFDEVWPDGDPGFSAGDLGESDLDIETMSGVAPGAEIVFVTSSVNSGGVDTSVNWAVDQTPPLGTVISYSYGLCEALVTAPDISASETVYKKAVSLGISMFAASGDSAAAICDGALTSGDEPAIYGQSVSYPASSAYVTGVGATEFDEDSGTGPYWSSSNQTNGGSAIKYIPETGWNDTSQTGDPAEFDGTGGGPSNCANGTGTTTVDGTFFEICDASPNGGFPKPTWQSSVTPTDSVRDVPDIAFSGSNFNDPYIVCTAQSETNGSSSTSTCVDGINTALITYNSAFGGTSAPTPVTAGMAALLNQYTSANGLGLFNPELYNLFTINQSGVFNEINAGTNAVTGGSSSNIVTCTFGDPTFESSTTVVCPSSGQIGFTVPGGHAYSEVTGLGSVNMNAFITAWAAARSATTTTISPSTTNTEFGTNVTFTATVTPSTATGTVTFVDNTSTTLGTGTLSSGTATFSTTALQAGSNSVVADYAGDGYDTSSSSTTPAVVTVNAPFTVTANPTSASVSAGATTSPITLTVTATSGFTSQITFTCPSAPTGVSCTFTPSTVTPTNTNPITVMLSIGTAPNMATGAQSIAVNATGGGATIPVSPSISLTVGATTETYTLTAQNSTYTVTPGQTASVTITVASTSTPSFISNGTTVVPVTYSCSDPASESLCSGPSSATNTTSVSFSITTTAPTGQLRRPLDRGPRYFYAMLAPGLLGIVFIAGSRQRLSGMRMLGMIMVLGCSTLWLGSCSGSNNSTSKNPGTPANTSPGYTITINATTGGANPVTSSTTVILAVQ